MVELVMIRRGSIASPADDLSLERFSAIKPGSMFRVQADAPRNIKQLRLLHVLLKKIVDNHPSYMGVEELKRELKRRSGMYQEFISRDGEVMYELDSISPAMMDQARFNEVWKRWVDLIINGDPATGFDPILAGITDEQLAYEIARSL